MSSSSSIATKEYENADTDIETGQEDVVDSSSSSSSTDTATTTTINQVKHIGWLVIGTTALLLIVGFTTLSSKYTPNKSAVSSIEKQTRNLIDVSSWASILGNTPSPTKSPTQKPIIDMSDWHDALGPTPPPTNFPTSKPVLDMSSWAEALKPTPPPTPSPATSRPTNKPTTSQPSSSPTPNNPYFFGEEFVTVPSLGIEMSAGLKVKLIARTGRKVQYANGDESDRSWHTNSDAAGIIPLEDGGYVYMSNSEADDGKGGVHGLYFNAKGEIVEYKALLTGTTDNCGGGLTPWKTWVSCEEESDVGQCWQVGPDGRAEETVLGEEGGNYESVAVDDRVYHRPVFFTTEDSSDGALRRFIASQHGWDALHSEGEHSYLHLLDDGTFEWTTSLSTGRDSAEKYFPNAEGIQVHEGKVYFMSKEKQIMIILNQENMTWTSEKTGKKFYGEGSFGGQPDQHVFGPTRKYIYFTEDGSSDPGVYARYDDDGTYFTMFQAIRGGIHTDDETIGIALSPDNKRFYAGFQVTGYIFEFMREDGLPFE